MSIDNTRPVSGPSGLIAEGQYHRYRDRRSSRRSRCLWNLIRPRKGDQWSRMMSETCMRTQGDPEGRRFGSLPCGRGVIAALLAMHKPECRRRSVIDLGSGNLDRDRHEIPPDESRFPKSKQSIGQNRFAQIDLCPTRPGFPCESQTILGAGAAHRFFFHRTRTAMYKLETPSLLFESSRVGRSTAIVPGSDVPERPLDSLIPT